MEKKYTQNIAAFVAFYDKRAVWFVLPDEMTDVSIEGLQHSLAPRIIPIHLCSGLRK